MSLKRIGPGDDLEDFQEQQAGRIRVFLARLADDDDDLLRRYIDDRVDLLRNEGEALGLQNEDIALLLSDDYSRVYEVMSKGSAPQRWIVVWIV